MSSRSPEQFVEHVAEPGFEHVHLGIRDRRVHGPIVDDAPGLNVVFDRAAKARRGAWHDIKIGWQFAERGAVAQRGACQDIAAGSLKHRAGGTAVLYAGTRPA